MSAFFDYFAVTLHVEGDLDRALSVCMSEVANGLQDFGNPGKGMYWYSETIRYEGAIIAWGGAHQKDTIFISITGKGCRHFTEADFRGMVQRLSEYGRIVPKRFDLALDVEGWETYYDIKGDMDDFFLSQRVTALQFNEDFDRHSGEQVGGTIYFGSRESPRMTRVYLKHRDDGKDVTRIEVECKEGWAELVLANMMAGHEAGRIMAGLSRDYIDLADWLDVGGCQVEMTYPRKERIKQKAAWLLSIAGCIEDVRQVYGDQYIKDLAFKGWHKRGRAGDMPMLYVTPGSNTGVQMSFLNTVLADAEGTAEP